ncbi:hypothetical protein CAP35_12870 [Chitinophagaceae bacterium IBVUCB1]|nr:hypothetical protein CAP35_12870 [Chitinophagaceae bacterium IBVUCB1]
MIKYVLFLLSLFYASNCIAQDVPFEGIKKINGQTLYFKVIGKGEPLLIVHGGPGLNMQYIEPHLRYLADNYQLIFFDPRSTGASDIPNDSNATEYKYLINDIEAIRKVFNIAKLNILAHSWGAKLALHYALKYPDNLQSLILVAPSALGNSFDTAQQNYMNNRAVQPAFFEKKKEIMQRHISLIEIRQRHAFLFSMYNAEDVDKIALTYPENYAEAQTALFRGLSHDYKIYDTDFYNQLPKIKVPVLIVRGDADAIPLAAQQKMQQSLGNATLVRLSKSGHFPFIEEPERFREVLRAFIDKLK